MAYDSLPNVTTRSFPYFISNVLTIDKKKEKTGIRLKMELHKHTKSGIHVGLSLGKKTHDCLIEDLVVQISQVISS